MPQVIDYRTSAYDTTKLNACGRYVGNSSYWRLYAIENIFRILVHSVLSVQIAPNWWPSVVTGKWNRQVQERKQEYINRSGGTLPGSHEIYYVFLKDLTKILAAERNRFIQPIPDVDQWIIDLEEIRLPRNIVGHMNWLNAADRHRIDQTYRAAKILIRDFSHSGIAIVIP